MTREFQLVWFIRTPFWHRLEQSTKLSSEL